MIILQLSLLFQKEMHFSDWFGIKKINQTPCGCGVGFSEFNVGWKIQISQLESSEKIGFAHLQAENLMCPLISSDDDI